MSGFQNGRINLDEERDTYYAGQVVCGTLEFNLNQSLEFKAIKLIYHGEATVSWEENESEEYNGQRIYNTVQYNGQEVYFHIEECVCGGVGVSRLQPGSHSIPFSFQIPRSVPSTLNDDPDDTDDGHISYYVKAVLDYADGRESEELLEGFNVVVPVDLNLNPEMKTESEVIIEEPISSFFCGSGLLKVVINLPASGFCPGQTIPVRVEANNQSTVEVVKIVFELAKRVKYVSIDPPSEKVEPECSLKTTKTGAVPARTKRRFTHYFEVPDMIPAITDNCRIINVQYVFKIKLILSGCNDPQEDEMDIYLGQIPLRELNDGTYKHPLQSDLPRAPIPDPTQPCAMIQPTIYPSETVQVINNQENPGVIAPAYANPVGAGNPYPTGAPNPYPGAPNAYPGAPNAYPGAPNAYPGANPYPGAPNAYPTGAPNAYPPGAPNAYPTGAPNAYPPGAPNTYPPGAPNAYPTGAPNPYPTGAPNPYPGYPPAYSSPGAPPAPGFAPPTSGAYNPSAPPL